MKVTEHRDLYEESPWCCMRCWTTCYRKAISFIEEDHEKMLYLCVLHPWRRGNLADLFSQVGEEYVGAPALLDILSSQAARQHRNRPPPPVYRRKIPAKEDSLPAFTLTPFFALSSSLASLDFHTMTIKPGRSTASDTSTFSQDTNSQCLSGFAYRLQFSFFSLYIGAVLTLASTLSGYRPRRLGH